MPRDEMASLGLGTQIRQSALYISVVPPCLSNNVPGALAAVLRSEGYICSAVKQECALIGIEYCRVPRLDEARVRLGELRILDSKPVGLFAIMRFWPHLLVCCADTSQLH